MILWMMYKMLCRNVKVEKLMVSCYESLKVRFFPKYQTGISVTDVELSINVVKNCYRDESTL